MFPRGNLEISNRKTPGSPPQDGTPEEIRSAGSTGRTGGWRFRPKGLGAVSVRRGLLCSAGAVGDQALCAW